MVWQLAADGGLNLALEPALPIGLVASNSLNLKPCHRRLLVERVLLFDHVVLKRVALAVIYATITKVGIKVVASIHLNEEQRHTLAVNAFKDDNVEFEWAATNAAYRRISMAVLSDEVALLETLFANGAYKLQHLKLVGKIATTSNDLVDKLVYSWCHFFLTLGTNKFNSRKVMNKAIVARWHVLPLKSAFLDKRVKTSLTNIRSKSGVARRAPTVDWFLVKVADLTNNFKSTFCTHKCYCGVPVNNTTMPRGMILPFKARLLYECIKTSLTGI